MVRVPGREYRVRAPGGGSGSKRGVTSRVGEEGHSRGHEQGNHGNHVSLLQFSKLAPVVTGGRKQLRKHTDPEPFGFTSYSVSIPHRSRTAPLRNMDTYFRVSVWEG